MGLVLVERNRFRESMAYFNAALKQQSDYGPALLNIAVVSQTYLNNRPYALQKYREYLVANAHATDWDSVKATAHQLEEELTPVANPATNAVNPTNVPRPASNNLARTVPAPPRIEPVSNTPRSEPVELVRTSAPSQPVVKPDVVRLPDSPTVKVADGVDMSPVSRPPQPSNSSPDPQITARASDYAEPATPEKRGFLQRMNPFHRDPKPVATPTPLPPPESPATNPVQVASVSRNTGTMSRTATPAAQPLPIARYTYVSPPRPAEGDHKEGARLFTQGAQAQHDHETKQAVALYRAATQADPAYFEAQLNLGFTAFDAGDITQSLLAYETALAIKPDSFIARFNFALALQRANYIQDSAQELERLIASSPADEPPQHLALAHLTLANLYANEFHRPAFARPHYLKVLDLDPHNSQATVIRYWLSENH
jgi:tetratricopeptide (TPR) repeat protein